MKPVPCPYCERLCGFNEKDQHIEYCGSKTKKCEMCQQNVCNKDFDIHYSSGQCQQNMEIKNQEL